MLDRVTRVEILEVGIVVREVGERGIVRVLVVGRQHGAHLDGLRRDLACVQVGVGVLLEDLDLALIGNDNLTGLLPAHALHVHHPELRSARRGTHAEDGRLGLDGVAHVDRITETHVDVLEVGPGVLRDVLHRLAESYRHHQPGGYNQPAVAVDPGVAQVLVERIRGEREIREVRT